MRTRSHACAVRRAVWGLALSFVLAGSLSACKPTDFFTEVVITPFSETVDYDNSFKTVVNSPDAIEESPELTALAWTDESPRSEVVENLVTYSAEPTSTLTAHHSIYDLYPRFPGIEASDPVRLTFEPEAELDREAQASEQDTSAPEAASRSVGGAESQEGGEAVASQSASTGESAGRGEAGEEAGGADRPGNDPDGTAPSRDTPGEEEGPAESPQGDSDGPADNPEAPGEDPYGGYNGEVAIYNPNDGFAEVNNVEHLAVLGGDVAVLAQSLGGAGAVCAMNEDAWYGLDAQGLPLTTYAHFSDVFSGEFPADFEDVGLLWSGSGSSPASVKDIDALVSLCGQGGVIVYDQRTGYAETLFDLDQRKRLQKAEIQLVPVDLSTVQGMLDAAQVVGEALSESSECAEDASAMAREYADTVNSIVRSVVATNGGYLATHNGGTATLAGTLLTSYNSPPVRTFRYKKVYGYIATDSEAGLSFTPSSKLDVSDVVLFGNNSAYMSTPLSCWMQAAGVWDRTAAPGSPSTGLTVLWPNAEGRSSAAFGGGSSGGALTRWLGSPLGVFSGYDTNWNVMAGEGGSTVVYAWGLGSSQVPYLIVCASDGKSAAQVKDAVVRSMQSFELDGMLTPYSVLRHERRDGISTGVPFATVGDFAFTSTIGATNDTMSESPFFLGTEPLAVEDVVRENPTGLLGSWAEGTMESVLEAIWIADVYSRSPQGCDYVPVTDMGGFSVSIGGVNCTTTRDAVLQFYSTFYRCDASGAYDSIVTDEGL
ncbi:MAG: hypothetical protein LBL86_08770 [Coriobacteriales bacterium]|nr:hypothetical protein [Coriobacteriales bacterium]